MLPLTRNVAALQSMTSRSSSQVRRIKLRSSSGTVTFRCQKSPIVHRNPFAGSCTEKNCDPVFDELSDLRENKGFQCMAKSPDYYAALQRNFSVYYFWLELAEREFQDGISNVQDVAADIPNLHTDFIQRVKVEEDLRNACEDVGDFELNSFNEGITDSFSSFNSPDLDYLEDQMIEFPLVLREPDCKIVHHLTELDAGNVVTPLISEQIPENIDSDRVSGGKMHKSLTSTRSKKRTRLNPAIARGSFSANFFGDLQFKSVNEIMMFKESSCDSLKCNEVLSDSNSEYESDLEFVQIVQKEGRLSKPKQKRMKKTAAARKSSKVRRGPLPRQAVNVLTEWMDRNISNPFATKDEKVELKELSGLTLHQVDNWLSNARYKMKNQKSRAASSEEQMTCDHPIRKELNARNKRKLFTS